MALQDGAQGFVRRRLEGTAPARLATSVLQPRSVDRHVRLVPREQGAGRARRRDASGAMEPSGARPAEETELAGTEMLVLTEVEVCELLDLDRLVDALADAYVALSSGN